MFDNTFLFSGTFLNEMTSSLWQVNLDGSGIKKILIDQFSVAGFHSNGAKIAFIAYDDLRGVYGLWIENLDGKFKKKILESDTALTDPIFMNKNLGYVKIDKNGNATVYSINFDGSGQKEIIQANNMLIYHLFYAKEKVAYVKESRGGSENSADIYVYDLIAKTEKRITKDQEADRFPVLSSDASKIAFCKNGKIWVGDINGNNLKQISDGDQPIAFI